MLTVFAHAPYRADIDGLRAIAVLAVVIFHIKESVLPGGFVGVDIFFVISGFLISQQLYKSIGQGSFSLLDFYQRRVKRIVPAMLVVTAVTTILSQIFFRPEDAAAVAKSAIASSLSAGNIYFWLFQDTGYFATSSLEIPLLHLWSLGVEEQFYMLWPLLLIGFRRHLSTTFILSLIVLIAGLSFISAEIIFDRSPSEAYYMLHTRAGELLVGALAAYLIAYRPSSWVCARIKEHHHTVRFVGYALIGASLALFHGEIKFPGVLAIPPTIGAGLILISGHYGQGWSARLLSLRPLVFFGLISYSLYLWHWPVMAFYRYSGLQVNAISGVLLFGLMVLLGWASYRYVETPFRSTPLHPRKVILYYYAAPTAALIVMFGFFYKGLDGYGLRALSDEYNTSVQRVQSGIMPANNHPSVCQQSRLDETMLTDPRCVINGQAGRPDTFMFGDSNSAHYVGIIAPLAVDSGISVRNVAMGACPPLRRDMLPYLQARRIEACTNGMPKIWDEAEKYQRLIISANWPHYQSINDEFMPLFFSQLSKWIDEGKEITLIGKAPNFPLYDRRCREKSISIPWISCDVEPQPISSDIEAVNAMLRDFAESHPNVHYIDFNHLVCNDGFCSIYDNNGEILYYDDGHFSEKGSWQLGVDPRNHHLRSWATSK